MHIPDGFLDLKTALGTSALAGSGLATAVYQTRGTPAYRIPLMGLSAAFIFAAQMINFPIFGGTSGHLLGGVLVSVLLGPSEAVIVISSVLIIQCFFLADGGITALGANIFNMAIVGAAGGYFIYRTAAGMSARFFSKDFSPNLPAVAFAAWLSVVASAFFCGAELALSGAAEWKLVVPLMSEVHAVIGVAEAGITCFVLLAIWKSRPELLKLQTHAPKTSLTAVFLYGIIISAGLILLASPLSSSLPDGLEKTAQDLGIRESTPLLKPLLNSNTQSDE